MAWTQKVANAPSKEEIDHLNQSIEHLNLNDAKCVKIEYEDGTEEIINDAAIVIWSINDDIGIETTNGSHQEFQDMIAKFREKTYVSPVKESKKSDNKSRKMSKIILGIILALSAIASYIVIYSCGYVVGMVDESSFWIESLQSNITDK